MKTEQQDTAAASLKERLERARAKVREIEAKREALRATRDEEAAVAKMEIEAANEAAIFEAEEEYGAHRIRVIRTELGCVIVKRPNHVLYKKFRDKASDKTDDYYKLVSKCVVYPSMTRFDAILDELPGVLDRAANMVVKLAGFRQKEVEGK